MSLKLGYAHPDYLLADLSVSQLEGWMEFYKSEPWAANSVESAVAINTAAFVQAHSKQGSGKAAPREFLPLRSVGGDDDMTRDDVFGSLGLQDPRGGKG